MATSNPSLVLEPGFVVYLLLFFINSEHFYFFYLHFGKIVGDDSRAKL